jgi:hypothetical protein
VHCLSSNLAALANLGPAGSARLIPPLSACCMALASVALVLKFSKDKYIVDLNRQETFLRTRKILEALRLPEVSNANINHCKDKNCVKVFYSQEVILSQSLTCSPTLKHLNSQLDDTSTGRSDAHDDARHAGYENVSSGRVMSLGNTVR